MSIGKTQTINSNYCHTSDKHKTGVTLTFWILSPFGFLLWSMWSNIRYKENTTTQNMALPKTVNCLLSFISQMSPVHSHERQTFKGLWLTSDGPVGDRKRQKWKRKVFSPWRVTRKGTPSLSVGGEMSPCVSTDSNPLRSVFKVLTMRKSLCDSANCDGQTGKGKAPTLPPSCAYWATDRGKVSVELRRLTSEYITHSHAHTHTHTRTQVSPYILVNLLSISFSVGSQRSKIVCVKIFYFLSPQ